MYLTLKQMETLIGEFSYNLLLFSKAAVLKLLLIMKSW